MAKTSKPSLVSHATNGSVTDFFQSHWSSETSYLCSLPTYRGTSDFSDKDVNRNLIRLREYVLQLGLDYNDTLSNLSLSLFQWCTDGTNSYTNPTDDQCINSKYWVFGFRVGSQNPEHKFSIITHVDTVPAAAASDWEPFDPLNPKPDTRSYPNGASPSPQEFLIGRGCIDDKGPAISALIVLRALASALDELATAGSDVLSDTQLELVFDTSEETDMSTPHYLEDDSTIVPDIGIVYDAFWCVRAEKGGERPYFFVDGCEKPSSGIYVDAFETSPSNSSNTIPDWAEAVVRGDAAELSSFAKAVQKIYEDFAFDDENYQRAAMTHEVENEGQENMSLKLRTVVAGAQHGSAPQENRAGGASPLVSLANFVAGLLEDGTFQISSAAILSNFVRWMWGTRVFGEYHKQLYEHDEVFEEGNGTTYAVSKMEQEGDGGFKFWVDIRYALGHHSTEWDGETEGMLTPNESSFKDIFERLVSEFNEKHSTYSVRVQFSTDTLFAPDIRLPEKNKQFELALRAYKMVHGKEATLWAIGGGTDAKGYTFLLPFGPLFDSVMGPPINYHGISEGAPVADMEESTRILFGIIALALEEKPKRDEKKLRKAMEIMHNLRENGFTHCCSR